MYRSFIEEIYPDIRNDKEIICWVDETRKKYDIEITVSVRGIVTLA